VGIPVRYFTAHDWGVIVIHRRILGCKVEIATLLVRDLLFHSHGGLDELSRRVSGLGKGIFEPVPWPLPPQLFVFSLVPVAPIPVVIIVGAGNNMYWFTKVYPTVSAIGTVRYTENFAIPPRACKTSLT
jgi:hypothetical protein